MSFFEKSKILLKKHYIIHFSASACAILRTLPLCYCVIDMRWSNAHHYVVVFIFACGCTDAWTKYFYLLLFLYLYFLLFFVHSCYNFQQVHKLNASLSSILFVYFLFYLFFSVLSIQFLCYIFVILVMLQIVSAQLLNIFYLH